MAPFFHKEYGMSKAGEEAAKREYLAQRRQGAEKKEESIGWRARVHGE
jgi:hypothetical protein